MKNYKSGGGVISTTKDKDYKKAGFETAAEIKAKNNKNKTVYERKSFFKGR